MVSDLELGGLVSCSSINPAEGGANSKAVSTLVILTKSPLPPDTRGPALTSKKELTACKTFPRATAFKWHVLL